MKPLVAIFAHPDDEAFGPAGKIAIEAKKRDVYLICVTDGSAGKNSLKSKQELSDIRHKELQDSCKVLGVKKVICLNYHDGTLSNSLYHEVAEKIESELKKIRPDTLLTYEPRGVSGHIDHIAVSFITAFIFKRNDYIKTLLYYCIDEDQGDKFRENYFIYFPKGYKENEIDLKENVEKVWDKKIGSMNAHKSQKHDAKEILEFINNRPREEHFLVKEK